MDIELLKTFLEVSKTRHFGRAAELLFLTQSAVSSRIRQLENQLGVNLFTRHRNNIHLTPAGQRLLPYATKLTTTWQQARKEVTHSATDNVQISIGASAILWETYLSASLQKLFTQCDQLQVEARIADRLLLLNQLHTNQLNLLIAAEPSKTDELCCQPLGNITIAQFIAREGKRTTRPYLNLEWGMEFEQLKKKQTTDEPFKQPLLQTSSAHLARQLLTTANGYAFLPVEWEKEYTDIKINKKIKPVQLTVYGVWLKNNNHHSLIEKIINTIKKTDK